MKSGFASRKISLPNSIFLIFSVISVLCSDSQKPGKLIPEVETITLEKRDLARTIEKGASVVYLNKASISSPITGTLSSIKVQPGDSVLPNQPVAQLETLKLEIALKQARAKESSARSHWKLAKVQLSESRKDSEKTLQSIEAARADLIQARTDFLRARSELSNQRKLFEIGGLSRNKMKAVYSRYLAAVSRYYKTRQSIQSRKIGFRKEDLQNSNLNIPKSTREQKSALIELNSRSDRRSLEAARANYRAARTRRETASRMLQEATIRSPLKGVVATRKKEPGEEVQAGKPFLTVVRTDKLLVQTSVSEMDRPNLHLDQPAFVSVDVYPDVEFEGRIHRISPVANPKSRSFQVSVLVNNDREHHISPGMFARVRIKTASTGDCLSLPLRALDSREDSIAPGTEKMIYVLRNGHVFHRRIQIGPRFGNRYRIQGLNPGDRVVISNPSLLRDGMAVKDISRMNNKSRKEEK
ncbi:MAG: efflux RND transporter periplasmic adaptor subunit [Leptospiraceae bacterium]